MFFVILFTIAIGFIYWNYRKVMKIAKPLKKLYEEETKNGLNMEYYEAFKKSMGKK